jgi:hypothetical protein
MSSASNQLPTQPPSTPSAEETNGHIFNDDLLMNDTDLAYARSQFPQIIHVLDNPRLREKFAEHETEANKARDRVRALGLATVISATLALLAVATKPVWPHASWTRWLALVVESGGILAAVIAAGGLWLGPWKHRWLKSRLMTERLRQWHFQLLVRRGQQVEASCHGPTAVAQFEIQRGRWLDDFLHAHEGKLDNQLESLANDPGHAGTWLHDPHASYGANSATLRHVFEAYERLRLDHQYDYAVWKLRTVIDKPFWRFLKWPAVCQMTVLSGMASVCFALALICSAVLVYGYAFGIPVNVELYVRTGAIAVALIGIALRTIQEGLAPDKEIERYNDYRGRTSQLRDRFKRAMDPKERLHLMEELELASVEEMKGFLRTHHNARFVLT